MQEKQKRVKKEKPIKDVEYKPLPLRKFTSEKIEKEIKLLNKSILKLENSIKNHDQELQEKIKMLDIFNEELKELKFLKDQLNQVNI